MKRRTAQKKIKKSARKKVIQQTPRVVAVSGGFDPLHIGHVRMFETASKLGDKLVVILNNDNWLKNKKGFAFMPESERAELILSFPFVHKVVLTSHGVNDSDRSVVRELQKIKPHIFANGGDRDPADAKKPTSSLSAEQQFCIANGVKMVFGVGKGGKVQSSSWMIRDAARAFGRSIRPWGEFYNWDTGEGWHLKTLYVKPEKRLSLQYHNHRSERWVLVAGDASAVIVRDGKTIETPLHVGETFIVEKMTAHRLVSKNGGILVEVAVGKFDESDIVRLEDDHGRIV